MKFTTDWTTPFAELFRRALGGLVGKPNMQGLEIGTFEGRTAIWFLENVLTGPGSHLTCIDKAPSELFFQNLAPYLDRCGLIEMDCAKALVNLPADAFDFAYVDAATEASCTFCDAALAFRLVKASGILIIDGPHRDDARKRGIDGFLMAHSHLCRVDHSERQTIVYKCQSEACEW